MRAKKERHADGPVRELLRRVDWRFRGHDEGRIGDDGTAADLSAALLRRLDAAVVAPLTGIIHVREALLEQFAVARERIDLRVAGDGAVDRGRHAHVAVYPGHT